VGDVTTFVFDLDGTLITCRQRQVAVARQALCDIAWPGELDDDRFWSLKRAGATTGQALTGLGVPPAIASVASKRWGELVEKREWLALDSVYPNSLHALRLVTEHGMVAVVLTARKSRSSAMWEIRSLGMDSLVHEVFVVSPTSARQEKAEVLRRLSPIAFVGDTETDHASSRDAGVDFAAVTCGQRSSQYLSSLGVRPLYRETLSATRAMLHSATAAS
jgi:phosphoglycolate phosphatase-like HAD superfamily hydrolase